MARDKLTRYREKRDFEATSEPAGDGGTATPGRSEASPNAEAQPLHFVVQEHSARRLHWDLRLEHDGVAVSWAIPNGIPPTPKENRLAVHTEDHPLEYLTWHGTIPQGEYGAGTMTVWDSGTYEVHKWEPRKVEVTFHGERLTGRYGLFPIGRAGESDNHDWMIHRMDPPADPDRQPMPEHVQPMLARADRLPPDEANWSFEVKWDGVRAIAFVQPGRLRLESRNLRDITSQYPEVRGLVRELGMRDAVLDGEIVAFDADGKPNFGRLQTRMHVTSESAVRRHMKDTPVVYAIFDLLHLDGESLITLPYAERRARLDELNLGGPAWRTPEPHIGQGRALLDATRNTGLEGIVAKRLDSRYEPGARNRCWLKIKNVRRQELVIAGWLPGEGRRASRIGALLVGYQNEESGFTYAGRVGTGFTDRTLDELAAALAPLQTRANPFVSKPKLPRNAEFVKPELVAEIEFVEWTKDGVLRAPSFKGLREDKPAAEVVREPAPEPEPESSNGPRPESEPETTPEPSRSAGSGTRIFDTLEIQKDGSRIVTIDDRRLKLTNWDKVLYPATGFTKGDLITFYARIADTLLPHLHDRALTLKRYPNGVDQPYFYEKQSPRHRPEWVPTRMISKVNYTLVQERATLVWLANLADIELHTSLSYSAQPERPTMLVFDLDPGAPAALPECCQVGLVLHGMFEALGLESVVKTSGSKGLQVYVPLNAPEVQYTHTKPFAKRVAELLEQRMPELVVSRQAKSLRPGRVLVDWSQNDVAKTTVNVYSVRARERPGVSTPVSWEEVAECRDAEDPARLTFSPEEVLQRVAHRGDEFAPALSLVQELPRLT